MSAYLHLECARHVLSDCLRELVNNACSRKELEMLRLREKSPKLQHNDGATSLRHTQKQRLISYNM